MLTGWRKRLFRVGIVLLAVGIAFLILPPYGEYCEQGYANNKYCAAYKVAVSIGSVLETYSGAITAIATAFIGWVPLTLKQATDKLWTASEEQRELSEDTAKRQLRAYLLVDTRACPQLRRMI